MGSYCLLQTARYLLETLFGRLGLFGLRGNHLPLVIVLGLKRGHALTVVDAEVLLLMAPFTG